MQHPVEQPKREPRVKRAIAFRRDQHDGLIAQAQAEKHGNVSLIVQRAVDRELDRCKREMVAA